MEWCGQLVISQSAIARILYVSKQFSGFNVHYVHSHVFGKGGVRTSSATIVEFPSVCCCDYFQISDISNFQYFKRFFRSLTAELAGLRYQKFIAIK